MFEGEAIEPPSPLAPAPRRAARRHWGAVIGGAIVLAVVVFLLLFQWNWLRGPLARLISARVHRPVAITGNLVVHPWSLTPTVIVNDMTIGDAPWAGRSPMVVLPRLTVKVELLPLFTGQAVFPLVAADRLRVRLLYDGQGRANWIFGGGVAAGRPRPLPIGHLVIGDGAVSLTDVRRRVSFAGVISTDETAARGRDLGGTRISGALSMANPAWAGPGDAPVHPPDRSPDGHARPSGAVSGGGRRRDGAPGPRRRRARKLASDARPQAQTAEGAAHRQSRHHRQRASL
jgi:hypothetical protein